MVFLDGVPEAEAKALTIKMDAKRGKFKQEPLAALLKEIQFELPDADLSLGVGIPQEELMRMLTLEPTKLEPLSEGDAASHSPIVAAPTEQPAMQQGHVSLVQLFYGKDDHVAFLEMAKKIADKHGSKNISETVLAAFKQATA